MRGRHHGERRTSAAVGNGATTTPLRGRESERGERVLLGVNVTWWDGGTALAVGILVVVGLREVGFDVDEGLGARGGWGDGDFDFRDGCCGGERWGLE